MRMHPSARAHTGITMTPRKWQWKNKNGAQGGLLYESGNWGDILKMLWLAEVIRWKRQTADRTAYTDPFAGDVRYPLGRKCAIRIAECRARLPELEFLREPFLEQGFWPSAASGALLLAGGEAEVWDADAERREAWKKAGVPVAEGVASGWDVVLRAKPDPDAVLLIDPYDFLAEYQERLECVVAASEGVTTLVYVYNRSGRSKEAFAGYRRFRGMLDDRTAGREKRIGRAAADVFLPDAHHEMLFLPCAADAEHPGFPDLLEKLGVCARELRRVQADAAVFDY